jgi:hypothetical protein
MVGRKAAHIQNVATDVHFCPRFSHVGDCSVLCFYENIFVTPLSKKG